MLERDIQKSVVTYARRQGCLAHKFSSEARRSVPDYIFLYDGRVMFIEFKATGAPPSKGQLREHKKLREVGYYVYVVDDKLHGKDVIDSFIANEIF